MFSYAVDLYRNAELLSHVELLRKSPDSSWKQMYPMREDVNLYKLPVMSEAHTTIDFSKELQINSMEEV